MKKSVKVPFVVSIESKDSTNIGNIDRLYMLEHLHNKVPESKLFLAKNNDHIPDKTYQVKLMFDVKFSI